MTTEVNNPTNLNRLNGDSQIESLMTCLPQWVAKTLKDVRPDVGDTSIGRHNHSQKQHSSIELMERVLEIYDITYVDAQGVHE